MTVNIMPTQLIVRWSCGCLPESVQRAVVLPKEVAHTGRLENKRDAAISALFEAADITENDPAHGSVSRCVWPHVGRIPGKFTANQIQSDAFLKMVQSMVEVLQRHGT